MDNWRQPSPLETVLSEAQFFSGAKCRISLFVWSTPYVLPGNTLVDRV